MASPVPAYIKSLKTRRVEASIEVLASLLRMRQINDPEEFANATASLLLHVVAKSKWDSVDRLLDLVYDVGHTLVLSRPTELVVGNIVRRILFLIRSEAEEDRAGHADDSDISNMHGDVSSRAAPAATAAATPTAPQPDAAAEVPAPQPRPPPRLVTLTSTGSFHVPKSMFNLLHDAPSEMAALVGGSPRVPGFATSRPHISVANLSSLRQEVLDGIAELKDEIASADDQIKEYADPQIQPGSTVLVYKPNSTVEKFLLFAARKRRFTVMIAGFSSRKQVDEYTEGGFREQLRKLKVETILLLGGITAYMSRITTVVLNARGIAPCGAVVVDRGAASLARAAQRARTTVIAIGAVYRMCPQDVPNLDDLVDVGGPSSMSKYGGMNGVHLKVALTEVIPPQHIDMYITNLGPHIQDHLEAIIRDHYKLVDVDLNTTE